ncbi:L-arabinose transport system permease protein AraQ [Paenibacillus allorhizoplanae]|uniref:L-arabinose transport system permease protein AraQ n=1 Tax=Paenibacillus allorhizoplanae TaxID=2905648 RepID=A0ABN8GD48_9BACL|nr:carbohydrate ABC transporter permease [Paenibacillus allorhizoplanae]CAH1202158.1 L-arabinose transport system permease protein AraQ [Paenibacillus allorhizoplanae]
MRKQKSLLEILLFVLTLVLAIIFFFPIYFSLISAFKSNGAIMRDAISFPTSWYVDSFVYLWTKTDFPRAMVNSIILTVSSIIAMIAIIPMAAYAIERTNKRWTNMVYIYFLAGMMIPFQVYMIPLFKEMKMMGFYGSLSGPILIYISGSVGFGVLLYTSFLKGVPREIEEAAEIDGCSKYGIFWRIVFPLLGPCTASLVVLNGLGIWNDFLMPSLVLPSDKPKTMIVEIFGFVGEYASQWDMVFAGTAISIIPVLIAFIALQKYFVKGIAAGATKG